MSLFNFIKNSEESKEPEIRTEFDSNEPLNNKSRQGILEKLRGGLSRTKKSFSQQIGNLVRKYKKLDEDFWEELEEILIQADVGMVTSMELVNDIRKTAKKNRIGEPSEVIQLMKEEVINLFNKTDSRLRLAAQGPTVILVVGVNGSGKTTSIAKLAYIFKKENKKVLLAAGDTFRAAAAEQLEIWADRVGVDLIKHSVGADPGAVVFDAIRASVARKADILLIDTAGRLQNKTNLMKEITKIGKIIEKELPGAPHEVLLVLDASTGQNAISQAKLFKEAVGVTGVILTKLDGTAKGGVILAVAKELELPVKLVGIGEGMEDLRVFSSQIFAEALFEE
ncbi:MAG: signal recognition particle-docking protein FtsY [Syntrophomonadaceae bacterium]|jgi:fused signal recognition particle receptor